MEVCLACVLFDISHELYWLFLFIFLATVKNRLCDCVNEFQFLFRGTIQLLNVLCNIFGVKFCNTGIK